MDLKKYPNVTLLNHPLLTHKISLLRDVHTGTNEFRRLVKEIAVREGYEALRALPTEPVEIQTPVEKTTVQMISGKKLCFVPILRAGLGMVDGRLELIPSAKVGHLGRYRDESTHKPVEYYCKLPYSLEEREIYVLDPRFATGGSAIDARERLIKHGAKRENLHFICIIAAPEGVEAFEKVYPDIPVFIGNLDRCLNDHAYICPGLGDAGDRIFGTIKY